MTRAQQEEAVLIYRQTVQQALRDGFSTSGSLGMGLPGVRRLMDEFEIVSELGKGTTVAVKKWTR